MKLKGKTALVTGGSSGIGKAIAERFVQEGCQVIIADINDEIMHKVSSELNEKYGNLTFTVNMNVADPDAVKTAFDSVMQKVKKLDILLSNAGIQHLAPITEFDYSAWQRVLKVNLDGCFLTSKRAMQEMKKTGGGVILFTGSLRSKIGGSLNSAYVAAKHGVLGLNQVIATEGAEFNIRSNVMCPDYILTDLVEAQIVKYMEERQMSREDVIRKILLPETVDGQFTTLEDMAEAALFFVTFPSNALTGQSLNISHGWLMQ